MGDAAVKHKTLEQCATEFDEVKGAEENAGLDLVDLMEGVAAVKQAFDFIGALIVLNSRLVESLPPSMRTVPKNNKEIKAALEKNDTETTDNARHGYSIVEAAKLLGVDRSTLRGHLIEIPNGPAPPLPVGKIPCRKIGKARRIFAQDLFGTPEDRAHQHRVNNDDTVKKATSGSNVKGDWRRQIDDLRFEGH